MEATAFQTTTSTVSCRGSGEYVRTSAQAQRRSAVTTQAVMPDLRSSHLIVPTSAVCAPHVAGERFWPVVTISRRTLRLVLTMHGLIRLVDVAELLATELVSNAVRHTRGPAALRVRWSPPGTLRIGAWDADPEPPRPPEPFERAVEREDGRGLALVRACADV